MNSDELFPTVESLTRFSDRDLCELANAPLDDSPTDHLEPIELKCDDNDDIEF